jgi:hypothetical protein
MTAVPSGADPEKPAKFPLGRVFATANAAQTLDSADIIVSLNKHQAGIWGDVGPEDRQANEDALLEMTRLFSVYHASDGTKFWIITEWDRSITTVMLPEDY